MGGGWGGAGGRMGGGGGGSSGSGSGLKGGVNGGGRDGDGGGGGGAVWCGDGWMVRDDPAGWASGLFTSPGPSTTPEASPFDHGGWAEGIFAARPATPQPSALEHGLQGLRPSPDTGGAAAIGHVPSQPRSGGGPADCSVL